MEAVITALWIVLGLAVGFLVLIVAVLWAHHSFYVIGPAEKIYFYRMGTYSHTAVNGDYFDWYSQPAQAAVRAKGGRVLRGEVFGLDVAFGCWPFTLGFRVPTTQFEVPVHVGGITTGAGSEDAPMVLMQGDATWQFRLSDNPVHLGMAFHLFDFNLSVVLSKSQRDLTDDDVIFDIGSDGAEHQHPTERIAVTFHETVDKPTQEALRHASTAFGFTTTAVPGVRHIMAERPALERAVKESLAEDEDTIFSQGQLLRRVGATVVPGDALLVCNLVIESLKLQPATAEDSEARRAVDYAFIGRQEGLRQQTVERLRRYGEAAGQRRLERLRRIGQAEGTDALVTRLGLTDKQKVLLLDVLREREGNFNITSVAGLDELRNLLDHVDRFFGGPPAP
jgi:hypothetical protein